MNQVKIVGLFLSIMTIGVSASANICSSDWLAAASGPDVDAFIDAGMDPNGVCTIIRNRPLHQALLTPGINPNVIEALIKNGARLDIRNSEGETAFDLAEERFAGASEGSPGYWRERAVYNAVVGSLETDQFTAATDAHNQLCDLGWWRRSASGPAVQQFLDIPGIDPDHRCANGDRIIQVPLRLTAFRLLPEGVFWGITALVDAGADLTVRNDQGDSALDIAERRYGLVTARFIQGQRRWCRGEVEAGSVNNEYAQNRFDKSMYVYITSVFKEEPYRQALDETSMELYGTTDESITKDIVCPHRGIDNYR